MVSPARKSVIIFMMAMVFRFVVAGLLCSAPQMTVAKSIHSQVKLWRESIDPAVGRYVQTLRYGDYRGKRPETLHRWR